MKPRERERERERMESKLSSNNGNPVLLISIRNTRRCSIQVKSIFLLHKPRTRFLLVKCLRLSVAGLSIGGGWELLLKSRQHWRDQYQLTVSWQIFSAFRLGGPAVSPPASLKVGPPLHLHLHLHNNTTTTKPRCPLSSYCSEVQHSKHLGAGVLPGPWYLFAEVGYHLFPAGGRWWSLYWCWYNWCDTVTLPHW